MSVWVARAGWLVNSMICGSLLNKVAPAIPCPKAPVAQRKHNANKVVFIELVSHCKSCGPVRRVASVIGCPPSPAEPALGQAYWLYASPVPNLAWLYVDFAGLGKA